MGWPNWGTGRAATCAAAVRDLWHLGQTFKNAPNGMARDNDVPLMVELTSLSCVLEGHRTVPAQPLPTSPSLLGSHSSLLALLAKIMSQDLVKA